MLTHWSLDQEETKIQRQIQGLWLRMWEGRKIVRMCKEARERKYNIKQYWKCHWPNRESTTILC